MARISSLAALQHAMCLPGHLGGIWAEHVAIQHVATLVNVHICALG